MNTQTLLPNDVVLSFSVNIFKGSLDNILKNIGGDLINVDFVLCKRVGMVCLCLSSKPNRYLYDVTSDMDININMRDNMVCNVTTLNGTIDSFFIYNMLMLLLMLLLLLSS